MDDVNALTYGKTPEYYCRTLQNIYECCLEWASKHGASFALKKYILVHFTKARIKHNTACPLTLLLLTITPCPLSRFSGVILDKELSWQPHLQLIKSKLATQTNILTRLTASTWGTSLRVSRLICTAVMSPAVTTSSLAWWAPPYTPIFHKGVGE